MKRLKIVPRLVHIQWVLLRHGLDELVLKTHLFRPVRFLLYLSPGLWLNRHTAPRGQRIRQALEDLGPIYVKFGQALSTRRDLLPDDIAAELALLQDRVPPFSGELAKAEIAKALGQPVEQLFRQFDAKPMASASVAQVHAATLLTGENVVVKVLRPDIEPRIQSDMALLYELAGLAQRFWPDAKRLRPKEVAAEFEKTTLDELDLQREAANAAKLRRNFDGSEMLYVPEIHWPMTRRTVLVMERIYGIPVGDIERLHREQADFKRLAERGVEIFFTQVFRDNFFHADMHPGNIFVAPPDRYLAVDFGIVGTLSPEDQRYLAENFLAFFKRDYHKVAQLHVRSGWVPAGTRVEEFEAAIRSVCEPIFEKPLKDISFGHLLLRLFQTARRFNMHVQPQLVLLQKTLLNIEGLGRQLYPELDLWQTAKPYLEQWFEQRYGPKARLKQLAERVPDWLERVPELPDLIDHALTAQARQNQYLAAQTQEIEHLKQALQKESARNRAFWFVSLGALASWYFFKF